MNRHEIKLKRERKSCIISFTAYVDDITKKMISDKVIDKVYGRLRVDSFNIFVSPHSLMSDIHRLMDHTGVNADITVEESIRAELKKKLKKTSPYSWLFETPIVDPFNFRSSRPVFNQIFNGFS